MHVSLVKVLGMLNILLIWSVFNLCSECKYVLLVSLAAKFGMLAGR